MPDVQSQTKRSIRFVCPPCSGLMRRALNYFSVIWIACLLLATLHLTGCGITYNTLPLSVSPNSVSFGTVAVGNTQATAVTLQNPGLSSVTLSGMQVADPAFQLSSDQLKTTIPAGGTATLQVSFAPTEAKTYSSQIVVMS